MVLVPAIVASNREPEYTYSLLRLPLAYSAITLVPEKTYTVVVLPEAFFTRKLSPS